MRSRRAACWLAVVVGCVAPAAWGADAAGAMADAAAKDEIVELPPLEVIAPGKTPPPWHYVALGNIEVLSRCSTSLTRDFIEAHSRISQLLQLIVPAELQVKFSTPQLLVLTDQQTTPAAAKEAIEGFSAAPKSATAGRRNEVRFVPNLRLTDTDTAAVYAIVDDRTFAGNRLMLTANHVRDVLERRTPPLPLWFMAGVITLYEDVQFQRDALEFDPIDWVSVPDTDQLRKDPEYPRTLLPVRELFAGPGPRDTRDAIAAARLWQAQAALLVRWALDGEEPARRTGFLKFVARTTTEPASEALLQECLGLSYADLRDRLSDYLPGAVRNRLRVRAAKLAPVPPFTLQLATPAEIGRIKGEWERMEITFVKAKHPQYAERYALQAHRTLNDAYDKGARDPRLLGVIGLYEAEVGNTAAARSYLEDAARARVVRPRVYLELARLRYAEAVAHPGAANGRLSAVQANRVLEPLATAWTQSPPLVEAYLLAADVWAHSTSVLEAPQFALLEEGRRLFPGYAVLTYYTALLKAMHGDEAGAAALIARGIQTAPTPASRARFEQLRDELQRRGAGAMRQGEIKP